MNPACSPRSSTAWQEEFLENEEAVFEQKSRPNHSAERERIAYLEKQIQTRFWPNGWRSTAGWTFMMLDADIVVSPTSVSGVSGQAGLLSKWNGKPSNKGTGVEQPLAPHRL
jgi:hypothetical protein